MEVGCAMSVGERIRNMRTQAKLSRRKLGDKAGVSESAIKQYETGLRQPRVEQLQRIAAALGIDVMELLGGVNAESPQNSLKPSKRAEERAVDEIRADINALRKKLDEVAANSPKRQTGQPAMVTITYDDGTQCDLYKETAKKSITDAIAHGKLSKERGESSLRFIDAILAIEEYISDPRTPIARPAPAAPTDATDDAPDDTQE